MGGHFLGMKEERNTGRKEAGSLWAQDGGWKKPLLNRCPSLPQHDGLRKCLQDPNGQSGSSPLGNGEIEAESGVQSI